MIASNCAALPLTFSKYGGDTGVLLSIRSRRQLANDYGVIAAIKAYDKQNGLLSLAETAIRSISARDLDKTRI